MDELPENAPDYESRANPTSDNEYLHYINHKLGYTNAMLGKLYWLLTGIGLIAGLALVLNFLRH